MNLDVFIGFLIVVVIGVSFNWVGRKLNNDLETLVKANDSLNFKEAWAKNQLKVYIFGEGEMPWYRIIYVLFIYLVYILFFLLLLFLLIVKLIDLNSFA